MFSKVKEAIKKEIKDNPVRLLVIVTILSCFISYIPFLSDMSVVGRYLDGPNYIEVAKTFYFKITDNNAAYLPRWYYAVHLVGYPFFIRLFNYIFVPFVGKLSYLYSMFLTTVVFTCGSVVIFYKLIKEFKLVKNPFFISLVFIFFPPRWVIYHSVGASEPEFIFWLLMSLYFFKKNKYWLSYLFGVLATITRIFGVLLCPIYIIVFVLNEYDKYPFLNHLVGKAKKKADSFKLFWSNLPKTWIVLSLGMPAVLFLNFYVYKLIFNMFFAYYQWNAGQLGSFPFGALIGFGEYWDPGTAELYVIYMAVTIYGLFRLYKYRLIFWFCLIQFLPTILNKQGDFPRFLTAISMFVFIVAFEEFFDNKYFKWIFPIYIVLTYLYVWSAIPTNIIAPEVWINLIGDQV